MALTSDQKIGVAVGVVGLAKKFFSPSNGAEVATTNRPFVNFVGSNGEKLPTDYRAKLRVPSSFLDYDLTKGPLKQLQQNGGIVFPYTPQISYETTAAYANMNLLHTNFPVYSYKHSSISAINVTAKFTVQNDSDAGTYLSVVHLLRALTKMSVGAEPDAGTPPPVCRLDAYGAYMLNNVPVVVSSFRLDFPDNVDYYRITPVSDFGGSGAAGDTFGVNFIPTSSQIVLTLLPMYSRKEQLLYKRQDFLEGRLTGSSILGRGYL